MFAPSVAVGSRRARYTVVGGTRDDLSVEWARIAVPFHGRTAIPAHSIAIGRHGRANRAIDATDERERPYFFGAGVGNVTEPLLPALETAVCTNVANWVASVNPPA